VIQDGSQVSIHYTLTVDGEVVDSSAGKDPLTYVQGQGQIIPGLEEEIGDMKPGDKKDVTVSPEKGYGESDPRGFQTVPKEMFKDAGSINVGDHAQGQIEGRPFRARITEITEEQVTLDLNHPLAGKTLHFAVEVVDVS
jgi:FKBP-type peptidyl-prolyl cis-trans isomerase SlyD